MLNLNADDARGARGGAGGGQAEPDVRAGNQRKRVPDASQLERKHKIERLTDLCDRLLQRGVNVYDSTRELLAIEVRQRKGENLRPDSQAPEAPGREAAGEATEVAAAAGAAGAAGGPAGAEGAAAPGPGDDAPADVVYENRRCSVAAGQPAVVDAEAYEASGGAAELTLLWQLRWAATPQEVHGPFDSVTMHGWMTQGCFSAERPAEIRQCDAANAPLEKCWHKWDEVDFELYL